MSNPFLSARIPKDLNQRFEEHAAETGKSKTELLIGILAAYLDFPVEIPGAVPKPEVTKEMFVSLEKRLEERIATLEEMVKTSDEIKTDNIGENFVITSTSIQEDSKQQSEPSNGENNDNSLPTSVINIDNKKFKTEIAYGPVNESQMAVWTKKDRNLFRKHRRTIEEKQLPLDTPLRIEMDGKLYQLKCIAGKKGSGKVGVKEWVAELVESDNVDNKNDNLLSMLET